MPPLPSTVLPTYLGQEPLLLTRVTQFETTVYAKREREMEMWYRDSVHYI